MKEFYLYSENKIYKTINEMFGDYKINIVSKEKILKNNFTNQNILLVTKRGFLEYFNKSFFLSNNVVIFYTDNKNTNDDNFTNIKFFNKQININKFIDEVATFFVSNSYNYGDIKILGEKIINKKTKKETFLTNLEKKILILLINRGNVEKSFILEVALKIKKDTQTKTLESHLTRIRNKLSKINSDLKILSKGNKVFLIF